MPTRRTVAAAAIAAALVWAAPAGAQGYPTKPVRVLNGFPPGGATDVVGRVITDHLTQSLGKPFVFEPKPGAAGNIAGEALMAAPADGYTLYLVAPAVVTVNHSMYKGMSFDPATAFAPISLLARLPILLEVHAKHSVKSFKEFVDFAKTTTAPLNYGSPGIGSLMHLAGELLRTHYGFKSEHVPYRGTGPFAQAMMQKELDWSFDVPTTAQQLSQGGHVRLIAISGPRRDERFPSVPTLTEVGFADGTWTTWFALVGKAGTPREIIDLLASEVAKAYRNPDLAGRITAAGLEPAATTPEETAHIFALDRARWSAVVRANNIRAE
jgi:tripartite-type tricarboxylate transporter receptor subunit TctC